MRRQPPAKTRAGQPVPRQRRLARATRPAVVAVAALSLLAVGPALLAPGAARAAASPIAGQASTVQASTVQASTVQASTVQASTVQASTGRASATRPEAPVILPNGDRVASRQGPDGAASVLLPPAGPLSASTALSTGAVTSLRFGGSRYDIPADALPYLGRGLSPSLFDLAALRRAETGGRLPVLLRFAGHRPALPGVVITRSAAGSAAGYLTAAAALRFGAALARQYLADHRRASYGTDGMFGDDLAISLAGATGAAGPAGPVSGAGRGSQGRGGGSRPGFAMRTLTVTATNREGKPDTGDTVDVINVDNLNRFDGLGSTNVFYRGSTKFSVPAGHYWAVATFVAVHHGGTAAIRAVVLPQFAVRDAHNRVHVAAARASSEVGAATPRPSVQQGAVLTIDRTTAARQDYVEVYVVAGGDTLWVNPESRRPATGSLRTYTALTLSSPAGRKGTPYVYNLAYAGPSGVIPAQSRIVAPASLATVTERYYQDVHSTGGTLTWGGYGPQFAVLLGVPLPVPMPGRQIQYMTGGSKIAWLSGYDEFPDTGDGGQTYYYFTLPAGHQVTMNWNQYPLHPQQVEQPLTGSLARLLPQWPSAFRYRNDLLLSPVPFSDNTPGHVGDGYFGSEQGFRITGSYAVTENGRRIAHGNPVNGIPAIKVTATPAVISLRLTAGRWGSQYPLSPGSQTTWTWRSAPPAAGAEVPPGWQCEPASAGRRCAIQPLMTLNYRVRGMALDGLTPPGTQAIGLTVGHIQLGGHARVTGVTARVSYDSGLIWQPATVTAEGGDRYLLGFTAPAGAGITLRVSAADSAGGSIAETILNSYGTSLGG